MFFYNTIDDVLNKYMTLEQSYDRYWFFINPFEAHEEEFQIVQGPSRNLLSKVAMCHLTAGQVEAVELLVVVHHQLLQKTHLPGTFPRCLLLKSQPQHPRMLQRRKSRQICWRVSRHLWSYTPGKEKLNLETLSRPVNPVTLLQQVRKSV